VVKRLVALLALAAVAAAVFAILRDDRAPTPAREKAPPAALQPSDTAPLAGGGTAPSPLAVRLDQPGDPVHVRFKHMPRSGLLFDIDTGRVLWRHAPTRVLPIASLTKMMTALVVDDRVPKHSRVKITKQALAYQGSGVGVLPKGKRVKVEPMLYGLLLPSGNDAAIALAQRAAGTHSCASDLAMLARAVLRAPRLAKIVATREAVLPFPIKGRKLYLYNNNPLLRQGYRGTTGVKTGYTDAAGRCLVATARRGPIKLGVVLLNSRDPGGQATKLLDRGFRAERAG
jgi:D-alanyl-D-alanine carboxypeptidase (penicillin-binding protein 5/6)